MKELNLCYGCMNEKNESIICKFCGYEEGSSPESLLHLPPGTILQDKYLLGKVLGQGGFGITYLAWDKTLKIKLAIKEYLPQQLVTRTGGLNQVSVYKASLKGDFQYGLTRFLEEAQTLAFFNEHPNIVTVRDYFEVNGTAYLVMNYHEGVTLQNYLQSKGGKIPVEQALSIFMPALDALREVHATGVLHRDISPDNLLIDINGRVVLIDFGAARQAMGEQSKSLSVIMKAGYSPVEQYYSKGQQGPWTDIYAIASSFYRTVTGQIPSESMGRILQDDLVLPSQLGIKIDGSLEKILLKALAVKAEDRYQSVEEFQSELDDVIAKGKFSEGDAEVKPKRKTGAEVEAEEAREKKPGADQQPAGRVLTSDSSYTISDKIVLIAIVAILCGLLIVGTFSSINSGKKADYYIDYTSGTISIGDLPIGARVIDPTWEWEFNLGDDYSGSGEKKPVAWIIVAKDHYDGLDPHVTLLAEEIIGKHAFDNSIGRKHTLSQYGYNNWGESGDLRATRGLRPWLNSTGIHSNEGFYLAFSDSFKEAIISTTLPNKEWENGAPYSTVDTVFLPSTTELGDRDHEYTYPVSSTYTYFKEAGNADRVAWLGGEACPYWTRSPDSGGGYGVRGVTSEGDFNYFDGGANRDYNGVRPALNLKADTMVSTIRN